MTVNVIVPLFPPLQLTSVFTAEAVKVSGYVMVAPVVSVQPLASVTVSV